MTKVIVILSSICGGLEFWLVNHTSIYENSESNIFKNINFLGEILNNWPNGLLGANVYKTLNNDYYWQYKNVLIILQ